MERLGYRHLCRNCSWCMQVFDSPECIDPKFADDFFSIAIADSVKEVERKLQEAVNQLADWADENDMILNELKIKVMLFGKDVKGNELTIEVNNKVIEQKLLFTYLGVLLDTSLSFTKHIESIASKAMKSMNKISGLFRGRRGISVSIGLELYVSLVRPHLEHAAPVWAGITGDWNNLERVQNQCLKKILGAHSCSASNAVEVVSGIMPLRYRTRELCTLEYFKIMSRQENDEIKSLLMNAKVIKNKFTPLSFLVNVSKNVEKKIKDIECSLAPEIKVRPLDLIKQCAPTKKSLVKGIGSSKINRAKSHWQRSN